MKKTILLIVILALGSQSLWAQRGRSSTIKWLSLAVRGGAGTSLFINTNTLNDENVMPSLMPSYFYGARMGVTFGDYIGIHAEGSMNHFGQGYAIKRSDVEANYLKKVGFNSMDIAALLRFTSPETGFFIEAGPMFTTLKSVSETNNVDIEADLAGTQIDRMASYTPKIKNITVGIGMSSQPTDRFEINFGVKANYSFASILADGAAGTIDDGLYRPTYFNDYGTVNPVTIMGMLEFNYFWGFWGDASCGRGKLMLFQ